MAEREKWGNHCEFLMSSLGLAVGLGNIWRFPFVCYENGGGAFLIPYLSMLILVGLPIFFLEQSIGQYGRVGANKLFGRMAPIFKGLGYAMLSVRALVNVYYHVICAWAFYYLFAGFTNDLPWSKCDQKWNTYDCYSIDLAFNCSEAYYNGSCVSYESYCSAHNLFYTGNVDPETPCVNIDSQTFTKEQLYGNFSISPAEDYFNGRVLGYVKNPEGERYDFEDYGGIRWEIVGYLFVSWIVVCGILINGIQSYGKISYIITLSPYFVLTGLLAYSATLEGAVEGIELFFTTSDWSVLTRIDIWAAAASQILFSLSLGLGSQLCLASYNSFTNNTRRDAFFISFCNSLTSLYAGIVVFSILGFISKQTNSKNILEVVKGGIGLAFISYPTAVLKMDLQPMWSFLFFFMLINLALSSICGGVQTILTFIIDEKPSLNKHRAKLVILLCLIFFTFGIPMCTNAGILLFTVFDSKCTSSILFLTFLEVAIVSWVYGMQKFFDNFFDMKIYFFKPEKYIWKFLWLIIAPFVLIFIIILKWKDQEPLSYQEYVFPSLMQIFGWILELFPLVIVFFLPIPIVIRYWKKGHRGKELLVKIFSPSSGWYTVDRNIDHPLVS